MEGEQQAEGPEYPFFLELSWILPTELNKVETIDNLLQLQN